MKAVEFEIDIRDSIIKLPNEYKELDGRRVRVIILDEGEPTQKKDEKDEEFEKFLSTLSDDPKKSDIVKKSIKSYINSSETLKKQILKDAILKVLQSDYDEYKKSKEDSSSAK